MGNQIRAVAHFEINAGERIEFERLAKEAAAYADGNEPGTLTYDWYVANDDKTARIYELYESSEALLAHLGGKVGTEILPAIMQVAPMTAVDLFGRASEQLIAVAQNFRRLSSGRGLPG